MKDILKLYRSNKIAQKTLKKPIELLKALYLSRLTDKQWCEMMFKLNHGYALNLQNPISLNEKIQWLKINDRNPEYKILADKHLVRKVIKEQIGEEVLVPLICTFENPEDICLDNIELPVIIKTNHASGQCVIIRKRSEIKIHEIRKKFKKWVNINYYEEKREWQYKHIKPIIMVEKLITTNDGKIPFDFKFHCIQGKVEAIQVDLDRENDHSRNFYSSNWEPLPFTWSICAGEKPLLVKKQEINKPILLDRMIKSTKTLAQQFPYIRIDWYATENRMYFGELTFHHGSGFEKILPLEWDIKLGSKLII